MLRVNAIIYSEARNDNNDLEGSLRASRYRKKEAENGNEGRRDREGCVQSRSELNNFLGGSSLLLFLILKMVFTKKIILIASDRNFYTES